MAGECKRDRVEPWRRGKYEPIVEHGPERTLTVAGETLLRSWTVCLDCGTRLERAKIER